MSPLGLALRSMRHRWRTLLAAALGLALALAMVGGSLTTGSSLRRTLVDRAGRRTGAIDHALLAPGRLFREALAPGLEAAGSLQAAPVLVARGSVQDPDSERTVAGVTVWGVDARFAGVFGKPLPWLERWSGTTVAISDAIAQQFATPPESLVLRLERLDDLPAESPLAGAKTSVIQLFADEVRVAGADQAGPFSLVSEGAAALNVFVPLATLQERLEADDRANGLLVRGGGDGAGLPGLLRDLLQLPDLAVSAGPSNGGTILRTSRVFLESSLAPALLGLAGPGGSSSLSYFVNGLTVGDRTTPYSIVTAIEGAEAPGPDEIVLNEWLATDLDAKPGDTLQLRYFVPTGPGALDERTALLRVSKVVPVATAEAWRAQVPPFPGVADKANCRDWEPGMPVELARIRDTDEQYWDDHGLTPKAFVSLATGRKLWANRWGDTTAIALPTLLGADARLPIDPASVGLSWVAVGEHARASAVPSVDFSGLFLALGFLVIVTSLLLSVQLLVAGVEDRADEARLFDALGLPPRAVNRLLSSEAAVVGLVGSMLGAPLSLLAGAGVVSLLNGAWSDVAAGLHLDLHLPSATAWLVLAGVAFVAVLPLRWAVRRARSIPGAITGEPLPRWSLPVAAVAAATLFLAGSLLSGPAQVIAPVVGGVALLVALLLVPARARRSSPGAGLDWSAIEARRNPRRSFALSLAVGLGVFLVATVGANRHRVSASEDRGSGTGGFGALVKLAVPLVNDLRRAEARQELDLDDATVEALAPVPLRVSDGDDASCRSLGQALRPTVVGVESSQFTGRFATGFKWAVLDAEGDEVPVVGDEGTVRWGLKLGVGARFDLVGEGGRRWPARIAAIVPNNVLQGALLVSRARFEALFPSSPGFRWFLVEGPPGRTTPALERFVEVLSDHGVTVEDTGSRLAALLAVENAYLSVFLSTGWLSLLLAGLGVLAVVWRDLLRRRAEFALLLALGWDKTLLLRSVRDAFARLVAPALVSGLVASVASLAWLGRVASISVDWTGLGIGFVLVVVFVFLGVAWASRQVVDRVSLAALAEE